MDFPVCPSCGQSVIDDDVEDCPFCGSSMKAKPGSKPAAAKATPAKAAPKPAGAATRTPEPATKAPVPAKPGARPGPADDFPFEAEIPGAKTAIQAMPSQSKGRTLQVICPMCETPGYVPPTAVGKEVRCANTKCMVPIFKAPAPKSEAPPPPPPKKSNLMMVGGMTLLVVGIAGGIVFYVMSQPTNKTPQKGGGLSEEALAEMAAMKANQKPADVLPGASGRDKPLPTTLGGDDTKKTANPKTPVEFIAAALKQLNASCLTGEPRQRSKPYCRQLAADACFRSGDSKSANEHLAQLVIVGSTVPYYRIDPSLQMFWSAWSAGDKANAGKILDGALSDTQRLPKVGRTQLEIASRLAAALAATGRTKEALELLEIHQSPLLEGQLSARVQLASDGRTSRLTMSHSVLPWTKPQAVAATASLVIHGQPAAGRAWAEAQTPEDAKVECLAMWAETLAAHPKAGTDTTAEITDAAKGLNPAQAARVWARTACGRFVAGDQTGAAVALKTAQDLIGTVAAPQEPVMPDIKPAVSYKLPAATPLVQQATAAAEIAYAHSLWPDHLPQAEQALELALTFARGLAPASPAVAARVEHADQAGSSGLREILKKEFGLKKDDEADQRVKTYRKVLNELENASERRQDLQEKILSRLVHVGLKEKVWAVVSNRSAEANPSRRDDFLNTSLIGELLDAFKGTETEKSIQGAIGNTTPQQTDFAFVRDLLKQKDVAQAGHFVSRLNSNSGHRDDVALTLATYTATTDNGELALSFIVKLEDMVLREEAYRLVGALLTQRGKSEAVWNQVNAVLQATEKASLCHGLVVGLKAGPPSKELPDPKLVQ